MKAVVLLKAQTIVVRTVPDAEMRESTDVLLRVTSGAICGTDLHFYDGRMPGLEGHVIGHEPLGPGIDISHWSAAALASLTPAEREAFEHPAQHTNGGCQ